MDQVMEYQATTENELSMGNDQLIWMADQAQKRVSAISSIMKYALEITTHLDWVLIGGNPYLQETGASKIARLFNISWQIAPPSKVWDEERDGHYSYKTGGKFTFSGAEIDAYGMASTHDEFFIGKAGNPDKPQKKPQDVNERDIMQKAYVNCLNRGIKTIIPGLRNITVESLVDSKIDTSKIKGYGFNSGYQEEMSGEAKDQKAEIERMLKEMCGEAKWKAGLKKLTAFTGRDGNEVAGKDDINRLSEKMIPVTYGKVKKEYDKWVKDHGRKADNGPSESSDAGENQAVPAEQPESV